MVVQGATVTTRTVFPAMHPQVHMEANHRDMGDIVDLTRLIQTVILEMRRALAGMRS